MWISHSLTLYFYRCGFLTPFHLFLGEDKDPATARNGVAWRSNCIRPYHELVHIRCMNQFHTLTDWYHMTLWTNLDGMTSLHAANGRGRSIGSSCPCCSWPLTFLSPPQPDMICHPLLHSFRAKIITSCNQSLTRVIPQVTITVTVTVTVTTPSHLES